MLTGLGVTSLSMAPVSVPDVRASLASHTFDECRMFASLARATADGRSARLAVKEAAVDGLKRRRPVLVYDGDFPDPHALRVGDRFFAYATQSGPFNVAVMTSTDLLHWEHLGEALPVLPAWSRPGFTWSPAVLQRGDRFVMYVAVREPRYDRQAIAAAVAADPAGPFRPIDAAPLVFQRRRGGSIDPDPFTDEDGSVHLLFKSDNELVQGGHSCGAAGSPLMACRSRAGPGGCCVMTSLGRRR